MKLKLVELNGKTYAEVQDDKPIIIEDDGREVPFDIAHTRNTIGRLNGESKAQREAREAAEARLNAFVGIDDPEAARKALDTVKNLKDGDLVRAGEVETIKAAARKSAEEQIREIEKQRATELKKERSERERLESLYVGEKLGAAFSQSKFIKDKIAVPASLIKAEFGRAFKVEGGKIVGYDQTGKKIFSRSRPGEDADFDEALEDLINSYPDRDSILKGTQSTGSGARHSAAASGGARVIPRAEFDAMNPVAARQAVMAGAKIQD